MPWGYTFGDGEAISQAEDEDPAGRQEATLADMSNLGLLGPPSFALDSSRLRPRSGNQAHG